MCLNDRYHNSPLFCENRMFGKNPVLDLWPKMLLTNQIARFFRFEYLKNGLTVWLDFWYDVIKPQEEDIEYRLGDLCALGLPRHDSCGPIRLLDLSNLNISRMAWPFELFFVWCYKTIREWLNVVLVYYKYFPDEIAKNVKWDLEHLEI